MAYRGGRRVATSLARQVVRSELVTRPQRIAGVAEEAVATLLPSARHIRVHVHPARPGAGRRRRRRSVGARDASLVADATLDTRRLPRRSRTSAASTRASTHAGHAARRSRRSAVLTANLCRGAASGAGPPDLRALAPLAGRGAAGERSRSMTTRCASPAGSATSPTCAPAAVPLPLAATAGWCASPGSCSRPPASARRSVRCAK